jgi:hypothetical protein
MIFKDKKHQQQYLSEGYVVSDLLSAAEVEMLKTQLLKLKPDDEFFPKHRGSSDYHCTFLDTNEVYKRAANRLFKETFNPHVERLMNDYHVWNANFYIKQPGAGKFEMHQNWTHVVDDKLTSLTIWCPLVDTSEENGTIQLVPGTHKMLPDIATLNLPYYFRDIEEYIANHEMITIPLKAGQCVIFEDGMIHYSDVNKSNAPRLAIQILTGPRHSFPVYYYFNPAAPEKGFEVFEIDDEFFMKNNYFNMLERPQNQKSLGYRENQNKLISLNEYMAAKSAGKERRAKIYGR